MAFTHYNLVTLLQGTTLVHHMFNCSVKITDRLGRLEDLNAVDLEQPLKPRSINENSITKEPELVRMSSSTKLMSSIRHKISNASHFMQVSNFSILYLLTFLCNKKF